jgi:hypothetical protein
MNWQLRVIEIAKRGGLDGVTSELRELVQEEHALMPQCS